jgi:ribosomal protein L37AE/L43A
MMNLGLDVLVVLLVMVVLGVALVYGIARVVMGVVRQQVSRECPVCGTLVKRGETQCQSCEHDFAAAHLQPVA